MSNSLRRLADPLREFVRLEVAGGLALLAATIAALAWANSPWHESYQHLAERVHAAVNDGLMTVFFFVVGLEIKRELVTGELRDRRVAILPAVAALGGMVVPALLYTLLNAGGPGAKGWGIPMATDIAFALGFLAVLRRRVPDALKVFLLTLAVVDDIGAIVVIAAFYTSAVALGWLAAAGAGLMLAAALRRIGWSHPAAYLLLGPALWFATHQSGVHPTIAGVALGLVIPAGPLAQRLEDALHPWTSFLVIPVFALANTGIRLHGVALGDVVASPIGAGILLGLVAGKIVGVSLSSWLVVRLGLGRLPGGVRWPQLTGVSALAGIGFTVSLFVTGLAFPDEARQSTAKLAVLTASVVAAVLGTALLALASPSCSEEASPSGTVTDS